MWRKFQKIAILILALCQITGSLFGCKQSKEPDSADTEETEFALTAENLADYVIVANESKSADLSKAIRTLQGYIEKITGARPTMKSDFIAEGSDVYRESEFEILVGHTARDEDAQLYANLRNKDVGYAMVGKKVVIIGETASTAEASVKLFYNDVLYGSANKDVLLRSGENKIVNGNYEIKDLKISGVSISEYCIVYPAKQTHGEKMIAEGLCALLTQRTGYQIPCKSDSAKPSAHEIWIGNVNRITSDMKAQVSSKITDTNYVIYTEGGNMWITGNNANGLSSGAYSVYETLKKGGDQELQAIECKEIRSASISLMSYNVRCMLDGRNTDDLIASVKSRDPDVFAAQEAAGSSASNCAQWMQKFTQTLTDTYACVKGIYVGKYDSYLPIFYKKDKFELVESGSKYLTHTPDVKSRLEGAEYDRQFTYAILRDKATGVEFMYVNNHFDTAGYKVRTEEAKILAEFLEPYSILPTIVGGDFNTALDTSPITTLLSLTNLAAGNTLADPENVIMNASGVQNYTTLGDKAIDHVFVSKNHITVEKYEVWDNKMGNGKYPSDHIPVCVEITVKF